MGYEPEGSETDLAVMVVTTLTPVPQDVVDALVAQDEFIAGRALRLS